MYYQFRQNNTGGSFVFDAERGISVSVVIEADDYEHANRLAISKGLYFGGVDDGIDCSCCGDRWYPVHSRDGDEVPSIYGDPVDEFTNFGQKWMGENPEAFVHHLDGRITSHLAGTSA